MKKIETVIKPFKLEEVKVALESAGVGGMTVTEVQGLGRPDQHQILYGAEFRRHDLFPKLKIELVLPDALIDAAIRVLVAAARTGKLDDGKLFVSPVEQAFRIRTMEFGDAAV